jgi:hypothetical protein
MPSNLTHKDPFNSIVRDIPRTRVKVKCWVYSHIHENPIPMITGESAGKINCSKDILSCDTNKTIKGGGSANFTLAPTRNYMNMIYPNDYVVIYFDMGDGRGSILTFFGFVDRITRNISTDGTTGATTTRYTVNCTDFTKAFIMTNIYFNPKLQGREDMVDDLEVTSNLGGVQFYLKGITLSGSPAEFVMSMLLALFGFNSQCRLPESFPVNSTYVQKNRAFIKNYSEKLLPEKVRAIIKSGTTAKAFEQNIKDAADKLEEKDEKKKETKSTKKQATKTKYIKQALEQKKLPANTISSQAWKSYRNIEANMVAGNDAKYLIDLLDLSLIETDLMQGRLIGQMISWEQGSLWQLMNSFSNDFVNELFCDLRPLARKSKVTKVGTKFEPTKNRERSQEGVSSYIIEPDDIESNTPGEGNTGAVRFQPSIVMREYPFSTIEGVLPPENFKVDGQKVGVMFFGAIFSSKPDNPGRHIVKIPSMNLDQLEELKKEGRDIRDLELRDKTLDVSVISVKDIIQESVGRSDADHVNLIEVYSDITAGHVANSGSKFLSRILNPLLSPTQIMRHGLRPRKYETPFGKYSNALDVYGGTVDSVTNQILNIRWLLLLDHWYQHNIEYWNGTISTRAFPEIRVGYRLDIKERHESYYIEGVSNSWTLAQPMTTTFTVTRGQRNDPYPIYVLPPVTPFFGERSVKRDSRLDQFFKQMNPQAIEAYSLIAGQRIEQRNKNEIDDLTQNKSSWANKFGGYIQADSTELSSTIEREQRSSLDTPSNKTIRTIRDEYSKLFDEDG